MDQANTLRRMAGQRRPESQRRNQDGPQGPDGSSKAGLPRQPAARLTANRMRVISITSGKGGVGKSNVVLNLSLSLLAMGRRVFLLDADMGLANLDVLLGLSPVHTLEHVMMGQVDIKDVVLTGPRNLKILPSSSGISEMSEMSFEEQMHLFREMSRIDEEMDYLFIDTGAGISSNVLRFNASANEVVVVATAEPTSITDAYALMKLLSIKYHVREFKLIANSVRTEADGRSVYNRLKKVCDEFLRVQLEFLGAIPFDENIHRAVRRQSPLVESYPSSPAARAFRETAALLDGSGTLHSPGSFGAPEKNTGPNGFWDRLLHWKKVK
ncbi:MAG: MinD/ParA family protein [Deltaproteobacteria bacterium]|nr:MinD/ParA family protein [Deltaproteobacteria bacterium]